MATFLARITVRDAPAGDERLGMGDALGSLGHVEVTGGAVVFEVRGEAPDLAVASAEAYRHAAEVLDGYAVDVEVEVEVDARDLPAQVSRDVS